VPAPGGAKRFDLLYGTAQFSIDGVRMTNERQAKGGSCRPEAAALEQLYPKGTLQAANTL
jgi:hypothetical protein